MRQPASGRPAHSALDARRALLLTTALDLFIAHGYGNVSLAAIARAAHVAVRTIYVKFGGKAGLLEALIKDEHYRHRAQLLALPFIDNLAGQLQVIAEHLVSRVQDQRLMRLHAIVMAEGDQAARAAWRDAGPGQLALQLMPLFQLPEARVLFDPALSPADLCAHFLNCVAGLSNNGHQLAAVPAALQVQRGMRLFLRGTLNP